MKFHLGLFTFLALTLFLPRLFTPDTFFIQDEQPWIDRSQLYINSLWEGDLNGAARYPLSNHPAIPLMTVVGPAMNFYGWYNGVEGTYGGWSVDDKMQAAVWARYVWGIACSLALLLLYICVRYLRVMTSTPWQAALVVALLGLEPWIWGISRSVSVDVFMAIGVVGMLVSAAVAFENRSWHWPAISGAWFALAFVSKSPALITAPLALGLAVGLPNKDWRQWWYRIVAWLGAAYVAAMVLWPPFIIHPYERLMDVLARAELHSAAPESYYWPGVHPPLFIFTLSAFAFVGCLFYIGLRVVETRRQKKFVWAGLDMVLVAGLFHGLTLLYLQGDHARKNLPVLALLAFVGALGWVLVMRRFRVSWRFLVPALLVLQGIFVWPYWPHVMTSYNRLFPSEAGKRLLVDIGNGSRLAADYINSQPAAYVWATGMDSLILPYVDGDKRGLLRALPADGKIMSLADDVTHLLVPASLPARVTFDPAAHMLLAELEGTKPIVIISVRDVPIFWVYQVADLR
ncbi:MAG: hypothetical protein HYZ63_01530 [Candidatus Andersenbacteria bacterium]|nr:hypothetical protein [Candidatus Andersenbacteria bacterium]